MLDNEKMGVFMKPSHRYAYKRDGCNNDPVVTGICMYKPKNYEPNLCYEVTYEDGFVDYVPLEDVNSGAYIITNKQH